MKTAKKISALFLSFILLWSLAPSVYAYSVTIEDQIVWRYDQKAEYDSGWYGDVWDLSAESVPRQDYTGVNVAYDGCSAYHNVYFIAGHQYYYDFACGEFGSMDGEMTVFSPFCWQIANGSGNIDEPGAVARANGIWTADYTGKGVIEAKITGGWTSKEYRAQLYYCDVIDLTAAFGAGNEPSVSFCEQNMRAMSGTKQLSIPDPTPPVITDVYVPPEWVAAATKPVTITAYEDDSYITAYAIENVINWQTSNVFNLPSGSYTALARNSEGQVGRRAFTVDRLDTAPPSIDAIDGDVDTWTNSDVTLNVRAHDSGCGLAAAAYSFDNGSTWQAASTQVYSYNIGDVYIRVKDALGNISSSTRVNISKIDRNPPTGYISGNSGAWVNSGVTLYIYASDSESGLGGSAYSFNGGSSWQAASYNTYYSNTSYIVGAVRDRAGNVTTFSPEYISNIDSQSPWITTLNFIKRNETITRSILTMFNKQVDIEIAANDSGGSGLSRIEYQLVPEGSAEDASAWLVYDDAVRPIIERRFKGKVHTRCFDIAGNTSPVLASEVVVEDTPPTATHTLNTESWTNSDITISIAAQDDLSGVHHIVLPDGQEVSAAAADYVVANNGTYAFTVFDNSGNEFHYSVDVNNIDKTLPVVTPKVPTAWLQEITFTLDSFDDQSGTVEYQVTADKSTPTTWQASNSFTTQRNGIRYAFAKDGAGNISQPVTIDIQNIDREKPVTDKIILTKTGSALTRSVFSFFNKQAKIELITHDIGGSGVFRIEYQLVPEGSAEDANAWLVYDDAARPLIERRFKGKVHARCIDTAENVSEVLTSEVIVEDTLPTATHTLSTDVWTNTDVIISIAAQDDLSGVHHIVLPDGQEVSAAAADYTVAYNGTYTFSVFDNSGNELKYPVVVGNIDKTSPVVTPKVPTAWLQEITFTLDSFDDQSGTVEYQVTADKSTPTTWQASNSFTTQRNGIRYAFAKDAVGNISQPVAIDIQNIDREKPVTDKIIVTKTSSSLMRSFLSFFNKQAEIELVTHDIGGAGVFRMEYQLVPEGSAEDANAWLVYDDAARPVIKRRFNGKIHARCFDTAENVSEVLTSEVVVEDTLPTATHTLSTDAWTNTDVIISIKVQDDLSGVHHIVLPNGDEVTAAAADYTVAYNGTYTFSVFDNSGNELKYPVVVGNIDKTSPVVTPKVPTVWLQEITFTLDSFDDQSGTVEYQVTADKSTPTTWQASNSFTTQRNGIRYAFAKDAVGNISQPVAIDIQNIDREKPFTDKIIVTKTSSSLMRSFLSFFNKQAEIELVTHDIGGAGVFRMEYQLVPEGSAEDAAGWLVYNDAARPAVAHRFNGKIHARCFDTAENVSEVLTSEVIVEDTLPTATHTLSTDAWTNTDVIISIKVQDDLSGVHHIVLPNGDEVTAAAADYTVAYNGTYTFSVFDNSGNELKYPVVVGNIDKTLPEGALVGNPGYWVNTDVALTIIAEDPGAGLAEYAYSFDNGSTWQAAATQEYAENTESIMPAVKDKAGNILRLDACDITMIDKSTPSLPEISASAPGLENGRQLRFPWSNKAVVFELESSAASGIAAYEYKSLRSDWHAIGANTLTIQDEGINNISIRARSVAGNSSDAVELEVKNDYTLPQAQASLTDSATINIIASDALSGIAAIALPGGEITPIASSTANIDYPAPLPGEYAFIVKDTAGNESEVSISVEPIATKADSSSPTEPELSAASDSAKPANDSTSSTDKPALLAAAAAATAVGSAGGVGILFLLVYAFASAVVYDMHGRKLGIAYIKKGNLCLDKIKGIDNTRVNIKIKKSYVRRHLCTAVKLYRGQRLVGVITLGVERQATEKTVNL